LDCALKLKWKRKRYDFSETDLETLLDPIGKVDTVALSQKKKGSAIVAFKSVVDAVSLKIIR
jgi:DnaJ family protein C protein 17